MVSVGFFVRHFSERGTEVAIYDYAKYNEDILGNQSYIICWSRKTLLQYGLHVVSYSYDKFKKRFPVLEIDRIDNITRLIDAYKLDIFYTLTHGGIDYYQFSNKQIWKNCKTIKHTVLRTDYPEGDIYCCISNWMNTRFGSNYPVLPHMIDIPHVEGNLREILDIPIDAIVYGRYGSSDTFSIPFVYEVIDKITQQNDHIYFLFMNTPLFCSPRKNIIHLPYETALDKKVLFINTCDAMIHARADGETFGLSCGEFAIKQKNIITGISYFNNGHLQILQDKAIIYYDKQSLEDILLHFEKYKRDMSKNPYQQYTPQKVMQIFDNMICQVLSS